MTFESVIEQAKQQAAATGHTIEAILQSWEASYPGITAEYKAGQNGQPATTPMPMAPPVMPLTPPSNPDPALTTPPATTAYQASPNLGGNFQAQAQQLARGRVLDPEVVAKIQLAVQNYKVDQFEMECRIWNQVDLLTANGFPPDNIQSQAYNFVSAKLYDDSAQPKGDFSFVPIRVIAAYQKQAQVKEDTGEPGRRRKVTKLIWAGGCHGLFTKMEEDGSSQTLIGSVKAWDEESAKAIQALVPYMEYRGEFELKGSNPTFNLSLNGPGNFQMIGQRTPEEIHQILRNHAKSMPNAKPQALGNGQYTLQKGGQMLAIEGRVGNARVVSGEGYVQGNLRLVEPGHTTEQIHRANISFWDQPNDIYQYDIGSYVYVVCWAKPPNEEAVKKGYGNNYNGSFIIPIVTLPGQPPATPPQPTPYQPPTVQ